MKHHIKDKLHVNRTILKSCIAFLSMSLRLLVSQNNVAQFNGTPENYHKNIFNINWPFLTAT